MAWTAEETKTVYFCQCKHTGRAPLCDGSHNNL
ncbi:MAG: CDGSH iron-sulfur domain-containing protein [Alphaproteobacteria bacterium]